MSARRGVTLVEILIAFLVFGLIAAAAAAALRLAVDSREGVQSVGARLAELQTARLLMKEDFASATRRRTRDEFGGSFGPAFLGGVETRSRPPVDGETLLVAFVRDGWINPEHRAPRSSLQAIEYLVKGGALIRRARPYLDDARGQPRWDRVLISDVNDVKIEFLPLQGSTASSSESWVLGWPLRQGDDQPPRAAALTLTTRRYGTLRQEFWIGDIGGAVTQPRARQNISTSADSAADTATAAEGAPADSAAESPAPAQDTAAPS